MYTQPRSCTLCQGRAMYWAQSPQCLGPSSAPAVSCCKGAMNTARSKSLMEILTVLKHTGVRMWSITVPWHRTSPKTTASMTSMRSVAWPKKGSEQVGGMEKKILSDNTFPCSCSGEPCCSEEQVQWGCTQPIICEPPKMYCPLSMATRNSHSATS